MAKEKTIVADSFWHALFQAGVYKRSQGRVARQVTFAVLLVVILLAAWRLRSAMSVSRFSDLQYVVPLVLAAVGLWASFRLVNYSRFADFLIAVEAEMAKVSWPSKAELKRSSAVVIFVIFLLMGVLLVFDVFWKALFGLLGIQ